MAKTRIEEDVYGYQNSDPVTGNTTYTSSPVSSAPVTAAPSSGGGGGGGGGYTPPGGGGGGGGFNYQDLITQDPLFGQQKVDLAAESASDAAQRAAAIQRTLIEWGLVPDFDASATSMGLSPQSLGFLHSDISPGTKELADKNTAEGLSIYARLQQAHKDKIRAIKNALAARGMAASGEMGSQLGEEAQQYKQQLTDSEKQLLQYITGAIAAFTGAERDRQRTLSQYMMDAAQRQAGMLGDAYGGGGGGGAGDPGSGQYPGTGPTGNGSGNFQMATSPSQLDTSGGWGVHWSGPGRYEARKFPPSTPGGHSDTIWVKVGDYPQAAPAPAAASAPAPAPAPTAPPASPIIQQILSGGVKGAI